MFKFYHSEDERFLLDQASIRIRPLSFYRRHENAALQDDCEGMSISRPSRGLFFPGGGWGSGDLELHPENLAARVGRQMARQFDVVLEGIEYREEFDYYVYCFSYECSSEVLDSFWHGPPFDRVARIVDVWELAETISSFHPQLRGYDYVISPTIYRKRERDLHEPNPSYIAQAFEKPLAFEGNKEGRIVFFREDEPINVSGLPLFSDFPYPAIKKRLIIPGEMPGRSMARPNELLAGP